MRDFPRPPDRPRARRASPRELARRPLTPDPPPPPPPAAPAPARSVRACRRRGDAPLDDDPLVCKAVPLAWPPGAEFLLDGAPLPPRASRVRAEVDALRALDAASGASPAARLFVSLADVFVSNDVAHLVLTRGGGGARGGARGLFPPLTLAALISRGGRGRRVGLPESQARHYAAEMALAIDHMHRHARFAHGDVKPENILVDEPGTGHVRAVRLRPRRPRRRKRRRGRFRRRRARRTRRRRRTRLRARTRRLRHGGIPRPGNHRGAPARARLGLVGVRDRGVRDDPRAHPVRAPLERAGPGSGGSFVRRRVARRRRRRGRG